MAIRKEDVALKLDRLERDEVARMEAEIDALLREQYRGSPVAFALVRRRVHRKVLIELRERYERAGWRVAFRSAGPRESIGIIELE